MITRVLGFVASSPLPPLLLLASLLSPAAPAIASDPPLLRWSWEDVEIRPAADGSVEVQVHGAPFRPAHPGDLDLPARIVRLRAPEGSRPASFEIAGARTSARRLDHPVRRCVAWGPEGPVPLDVDAPPPVAPARVEYLGLSLERGASWALFAVYPVVIDPERGIELLEAGTLEVQWVRDPAVPHPLKSLREEMPARIYRGVFSDRPSLESDPVDFLLIAPEAFVDSLEAFLDWKNRSGTPSTLRTVEWILANYPDGVDAQDRIRSFLIEAYRYWGTKWVLVAGGPEYVPIRLARSYSWNAPFGVDIITDLYYACLDGNWNADGDAIFGESRRLANPPNEGDQVDFAAELRVGRIPAANPHDLSIWLRKNAAYVQTPDLGGYLDRYLALGEVLFATDWTRALLPDCGRVGENCAVGCPACVTRDGADDCVVALETIEASGVDLEADELYEYFEYWQSHGRPDAQLEIESAVLEKLDAGSGWVHHVGHGGVDRWSIGTEDGLNGNARLTIPEAQALANEERTGIVYAVNCNAAEFDKDCLAEALLFASNGGMVAYIGSTNLDFPNAALLYQEGFYERVFLESQGLGEAFFGTTADLMATQGETETYTRFLAFSLALLGDPQLQPWPGTPAPLTVSAPDTLTLGETGLVVEIARAGLPLEGAEVCVWKADDHEALYAVAFTDADGKVQVPFRPTWTGNFAITVTHPLGIPHREEPFRVVVPAPGEGDLSVIALAVRDFEIGWRRASNGLFEEGETVVLDCVVRNGSELPNEGALVLRIGPDGHEPYIAILDSTASTPLVPPGEEVRIPGAFRVKAVAPIPDSLHQNGDRVAFVGIVRVESGGTEEAFEIPLPCYRPALGVDRCFLIESPGGDGDGLPDIGETMLWTPALRNTGAGSTSNLTARLEAASDITVIVGSSPLRTAGENEDVRTARPLQFRVDGPSPQGRLVIASVVDAAFVFTDAAIEFEAPGPPTWGTEAPLALRDAIRLVWVESPSVDIEGYVVERALAADGPFQRVHPALVRGMQYFEDAGLEPLTRYYYRIVGVDHSGNPSPPSDVRDATTIPEYLEGWPVPISDVGFGTPTVADLDGEGGLEVFATADQVYAFHSDATEVIDGDGDASTEGIWSMEGSGFWARTAVADLDLDDGGAVEVVATSRYVEGATGTGQLLVWDRTGALLWQNAVGTSNALIASPVIADIDADERMEVIAHNRGTLYAWNHDGTPVIPSNANGMLAFLGGDEGLPPFTYGSPAVADLDPGLDPLGPGKEEVILGLETSLGDKRSRLAVVDGDGAILAQADLEIPPVNGSPANSSPALVDIDGDGTYEIFLATRTTLWCHRYLPGPPASLLQVWRKTLPVSLPTNWVEPTPALGDLDGNGTWDVVLGDDNRVLAVDAATGADLAGFPHEVDGIRKLGSALLVDLDPDPGAEIVIGDSKGMIYALDEEASFLPGFPFFHDGRIQHGLALWDVDQEGHPDLLVQAEQLPRISIYGIPTVAFPEDEGEAFARNPWPCFRRDNRNSGTIGPAAGGFAIGREVPEKPPLTLRLLRSGAHPLRFPASLQFETPGGEVRLELFDVGGRRVRVIEQGAPPPGTHVRVWDGRDDAGRPVASGMYWLRLRGVHDEEVKKLVFLR